MSPKQGSNDAAASVGDPTDFAAYSREMTHRFWPWVGLAVAAAAVLWWPLDRWLFAGKPEVQDAFSIFRLTVVVLDLPLSLFASRIWVFSRHPFFSVVMVMAANLSVVGWFLAEAGQGDPLWFAFGYMLPQFTVLLLLPLWERVGVVLAFQGAFCLAWSMHPVASLLEPGILVGSSFLLFCSMLAVGVGHGFFLLLQRDFVTRRTVEAQRQDLVGLTGRLEARVSEQTLALRALHHRAQDLRAEQRQEIARELHDGLGQELTSLRLLSGLGRSITPAGEANELFAELDSQVAQVQGNLRRVLEALQPQLLDEHGLVEALRVLLRDLERRSGVGLSLHLEAVPEPLSASISVALFRICQEGLNNALRHARARTIQVHLTGTLAGLVLQIQDDGVGIPEGRLGAGLGTRSIQERAASLGGTAGWQPGPGARGTTLKVTLPLPEVP